MTRKRLFLETMEGVLGQANKVIIEDNAGQGGDPICLSPRSRNARSRPPIWARA